MTDAPWRLRAAEPGDLSFVLDSWLRSYKPHWPPLRYHAQAGEEHVRRVYAAHHDACEAALARSTCIVACDADDDRVLLGWVVGERGIAHYVFVRGPHPRGAYPSMRNVGLGNALVDALRARAGPLVACSHMTPRGAPMAARRFLLYQPAALWRPHEIEGVSNGRVHHDPRPHAEARHVLSR